MPRPSRVSRARFRRVQRGRRRILRVTVLVPMLAAALAVPVPLTAPGHACAPATSDASGAAVVAFGHIEDDGELTSLRTRTVGVDGEVCEQVREEERPDVAVSILHRDAEGRALEATELGGDQPVSTRLSVRDTTAEERELEVVGPDGTTTATRRVGVPQLVRVTVRFPDGWEVTPPQADGVSSRMDGDHVEVARTAVLFPPLLDDELVLEVASVPGRGTPRIAVEATPWVEGEAEHLPVDLRDRDTTAVVAALLDLARDGARELAGGTEELAGGTHDLADGAAEVADGAAGLGEGMIGLADGAAGLSSGVDGSAAGARELAVGADDLADGTGEVAAGAGPLARGAHELATGVRTLSDELGRFGEVEVPEVDPESVIAVVTGIAEEIRNVRDGLAELLPADPDPDDPLVISVTVLTELADGLDEAAIGVLAALEGLAEAADGLRAAAEGADELATGAEELARGVAQLEAALQGLADGAAALASGTEGLAEGLGQLSGASDDLRAGADELSGGAQGLADGTDGLAEGTRDLAEGADGLATGADELPGALGDAMGVADRGGQRAAVTDAVLDEGIARAAARRGDAALVTTQLVHPGTSPLPWLPVGIGAAGLAVAAASAWWLRRRGAGG